MSENCSTKDKPRNFRELIRSSAFWWPFAGVLLGGTGGFLYYYFVGCSSGSCAITSSPYMSTLWGSLFGYFLVGSPCRRKCS